jgi:hypothetical protein
MPSTNNGKANDFLSWEPECFRIVVAKSSVIGYRDASGTVLVDPHAEPSPRRWLLLGFLTVAMFFCYAHRQALAIAAPFMMKNLGLNAAATGLLLSAFFWSYSLAQVPAGWLLGSKLSPPKLVTVS